eukprot:TRINITY_DN68475_c0_g1_i1.p1 TRINITY_DN68475_c0_g1~~TRINITY_DN68475_c0_g1_i1.p1  ORF type:complete len:393 (+),score=76.30 TRINITY_DN68475_c0_g1_i1:103-1281(+)
MQIEEQSEGNWECLDSNDDDLFVASDSECASSMASISVPSLVAAGLCDARAPRFVTALHKLRLLETDACATSESMILRNMLELREVVDEDVEDDRSSLATVDESLDDELSGFCTLLKKDDFGGVLACQIVDSDDGDGCTHGYMTTDYQEDATIDAYVRRVMIMPTILYLSRRLYLNVPAMDVRQDEKDFQRDQLFVNGTRICGSSGGYQIAMSAVAGALRGLCAASSAVGRSAKARAAALVSSKGRSVWTGKDRERAARILLNLLGRTSSGFATFQEVLRHYGARNGEPAVLVPQSAAATPLELVVSRGCVLGRAHTRFAVLDLNNFGEPLFLVDGVFAFYISAAALHKIASAEDFAAAEKVVDTEALRDEGVDATARLADEVKVRVMLRRL